MSVACSSIFNPFSTPFSFTRPTKQLISSCPCLAFTALLYNNKNKREFLLPSVASIPYQPITVDYLKQEFSGHGVTFEGLGDDFVATMELDSGSTATLMLPSGLITSYKAHMWHGGAVELLHTLVSEAEDGSAVIEGGVSLAFNYGSDGEASWSPSTWVLHDIRGNSQDSIEVELTSSDTNGLVQVRYLVSLQDDLLKSEFVVSNPASSTDIKLTGSVISHLTMSTPEAAYAVGLEGSNFFNRPPVFSNFSIIPPHFGRKNGGQGFWSGFRVKNQTNADETGSRQSDKETEGEENSNYKHLTEQISRIYTSAPQNFTIIDRGRRNSVVVGRYGFDELYLLSPGTTDEWYSKYDYICVGQSAMLKPIILAPGDMWRGGQRLYNPNL